MPYPVVYGLAWAAWAVVWAMAAFVLWVGPRKKANRRLALVFFLHGVAIANWVTVPFTSDLRVAAGLNGLNLLSLLVLPFVALWFLSTLDAAWAAPLRSRPGKAALLLGSLAMVAPFYLARDLFHGKPEPWIFGGQSFSLTVPTLVLFELSVLLYLGAFAVALQAFLSAPKGTPQRNQAFWFMLAFGLHDLYFVYRIAVLAIVYQGGSAIGAGWVTPTILYGRPISLIVWVLLLAYGMLRHQVLGLDLRLKAGLGRTAALAVVAATFFVVSELAEGFLPVDGLVPGLVAAGLVTLAFLPLQRGANRLLDRLLPDVADTPQYRQRRGQDIYAMALASVQADGVLDEADQVMLERLRVRLGLALNTTPAPVQGVQQPL